MSGSGPQRQERSARRRNGRLKDLKKSCIAKSRPVPEPIHFATVEEDYVAPPLAAVALQRVTENACVSTSSAQMKGCQREKNVLLYIQGSRELVPKLVGQVVRTCSRETSERWKYFCCI